MRNLIILVTSIVFTSCMTKQPADLIVHNANIYTVDESFSIAEAMAIRGDSIVEVGPEHQILNKYSSENMVDASKHFIYPGFIDAHSHFMGYAKNLVQVNLLGCTSEKEMFERVKDFSDKNNMDWIEGRGWDQNKWESNSFPTKDWLDENLGEKYIILKRVDGHAVLVNQFMLDYAGIDENTVVEGGLVEVKDGKCTGILIDNAVDLVTDLIPDPHLDMLTEYLQRAEQNCLEKGLTSVCDAGLEFDDIQLYQQLVERDLLKIKLYLMLNPSKENFDHFLEKGPFSERDLSIRSFKFYMDGALGSRGASLKEEYSDDLGNKGLILNSPDTMRILGKRIFDGGFQMNTHAIGDNANQLALNIYADILGGSNDRRWRIEHAQVVDSNDLKYFREYNIIPSVQPSHATSDMEWADERLGEKRLHRAYAYRSLMKQNGLLALGTDFPVEDIDPLKTLLAGMKRTDLNGQPEGGFQIEEGLTFEECLRGMTIWAAISNFEENTKGSLEEGKKADFVIYNRDLKSLNAENFQEYLVLATYINGTKEYEREKK